MEPWQSWAAAVVIGGAAFLYYTKDSKYFMKAKETASSSLADRLQASSASTTRRRPDKQNTRRKEDPAKADAPASYAEVASSGTSNASNAASKKRKAGRGSGAPSSSTPAVETPVQLDQDDDEDDDDPSYTDKEWARQLDARKKGISLESSKSGSQQKAKKAQRNGNISTPLPETAPPNRPSAAVNRAPVGGDVSDMLEPQAPGPSVIRVTSGGEQQKKSQTPRAAPAHETKKQRQNRRKAEEKKLQREEDERQRQALLESQRRSAREARGDPAKNGLATPKAPTTTVWTASVQSGGQPNGSAPATAPTMNVNETPLLDTFDHETLSTSSSNDVQTNSTTPATVASTYDPDLPSEETQLEMLNEMNQNSGWNEVSAKPKKGKKKTPAPAEAPLPSAVPNGKDSNSYASISTSELVNGSAKSVPTSAPKSKATTNGFAALEEATGFTSAVKGHPDDSDWAVL